MPKSKSSKSDSKPRLELRSKGESEGPLTSDECCRIVGWTVEPEDKDKRWGKEYALKDLYGRKIRLLNNPINRPFKRILADRYASEHIRGKWSLNLETIVIAESGNVLQGQHRLVGLILAEQARQIDPKQWGSTPLVYETAIGFGASSLPVNANTYDLGKGRTLGDVLYRQHDFGNKVDDKKQRGLANILSGAVRLVWLRVGGKQVSFAPHFPHSEALEFKGKHPSIQRAVTQVGKLDEGEEGNEKCISSYLSLSYAGGLLYLMARAESWEKAGEFWTQFASGEDLKKGSPILSLRQLLVRIDASTGGRRDQIIGAVIKAWLLWIKNKSGTSKDVRVIKKKSGDKFVLAEFPRIGGIDSDVETKVSLSQHQRLVLSVLRKTKKEIGYKQLSEATGLQLGTLSTALMKETKQGKANPHSLCSRGLVVASQYEPQEGEKGSPYQFRLSKSGRNT